MLGNFIPVPAEGLVNDFRVRGLRAEEVAAETLRALAGLGVTRFYLSNFETARAPARLSRIARLAGFDDPAGAPSERGRER